MATQSCGSNDVGAGFTASDWCCACGGGITGTCTDTDTDGQTDPYGDNCATYAAENLYQRDGYRDAAAVFCGLYDSDSDGDLVSLDMCCACGGGDRLKDRSFGAVDTNGDNCLIYVADDSLCGDYD